MSLDDDEYVAILALERQVNALQAKVLALESVNRQLGEENAFLRNQAVAQV